MSSPSSRNSPTFFRDELKRALDEQSFGILGYTPRQSNAFEAIARVELLEKINLEIMVSVRGFQVIAAYSSSSENQVSIKSDFGAVFETVDALLEHCSPMYSTKRAETLYSKLMA